MSQRLLSRYALPAAAVVLLSACERTPMDANPAPADGASQSYQLTCTAEIKAARVRCVVPTGGGGNQAIVIGGQNRYVTLTSSNIVADGLTFAFDVTVQNLIAQALGTLDGTTPHPDGVRVFFQNLPTATVGSGDVTVANQDGTATFTAADQPYYQYAGLLEPQAVSEVRRWEFAYDPGVESFAFGVLVSAEVQYTDDYVDLRGNPVHLLEGADTTFAGVVRDRLGNPLGGEITWSSSAPEIATVSPTTGVVTAVAPGTVTITATSGTAVGELSIGVCPVMVVGEALFVSADAASEICLPGDSDPAEYVYIPVNTSTTGSVTAGTTGSNILAAAGPPNPSLAPEARHLGLRFAGSAASARRSLSIGAPSTGPSLAIVPGVPTVGDVWDLNVGEGCAAPVERAGRVVAVGTSVIVVEDTLNPAGGLSGAQYTSLVADFDTLIAPTVYASFGEPDDIDGNSRVVAFFSAAVNGQVDVAGREYGYFAARDLQTVAECEGSNQGELIYLAAADPTGSEGAAISADTLRRYVVRTLAHELQHLTNASQRTAAAQPLEEAWLDEGLSAIAEELVFLEAAGLAPGQNIGLGAFGGAGGAARVQLFQTYANENFLRLQAWLQRPDTTGALRTSTSFAAQGALAAFLRYAADRAAVGDATFWSSLVQGGDTGLANLQSAVGGADLGVWLRDFTTALYVDDAVPNLSPEIETLTWDYRALYTSTGTYPLLPRPLDDGVESVLTFQAGGGAAYYRLAVPAFEFASINTQSGGGAPPASLLVAVVRTR